jgi:hypothetical protein
LRSFQLFIEGRSQNCFGVFFVVALVALIKVLRRLPITLLGSRSLSWMRRVVWFSHVMRHEMRTARGNELLMKLTDEKTQIKIGLARVVWILWLHDIVKRDCI